MTSRGEGEGARLSIGALSRATGIPVETLRTWEGRYGFPVPERKPSGHRTYPAADVARLRRIAAALASGHRAGEVVGASEEQLGELLATAPEPPPVPALSAPLAPADLPGLLGHVRRFEAEPLAGALLSDWSRSSPVEFLETRAAPLLRAVGEAWERGELQVAHEHFLSERLADLLRSARLPFEERARGPLAVLTTLPGEEHALGLQMAALVLAWAGCRVLCLGPRTPVAEVARLARDLQARAVAVSVSLATRGPRTAAKLAVLRRQLPRRTALLVGGDGAPEARPGVEVFRDLRALAAWARAAASPA